MVLAIDKDSVLYVFESTEDAELSLEAIDVQQDELEFCDVEGQQYSVVYTKPPKQGRFWVDIGLFKLVPAVTVQADLPEKFIQRARHIEHTFANPPITTKEALLAEIRRRASRE